MQHDHLLKLQQWAHEYGASLIPTAGSADTFGDGMREAKRQVRQILVTLGLEILAEQPPARIMALADCTLGEDGRARKPDGTIVHNTVEEWVPDTNEPQTHLNLSLFLRQLGVPSLLTPEEISRLEEADSSKLLERISAIDQECRLLDTIRRVCYFCSGYITVLEEQLREDRQYAPAAAPHMAAAGLRTLGEGFAYVREQKITQASVLGDILRK